MGKARPPAGDGRRPPRQRGGADLADAHAVAAWSGGGGQERRGGLLDWRSEELQIGFTVQLDIYISG
jgi:hypothetical protein